MIDLILKEKEKNEKENSNRETDSFGSEGELNEEEECTNLLGKKLMNFWHLRRL
jgi:hypothetical protein